MKRTLKCTVCGHKIELKKDRVYRIQKSAGPLAALTSGAQVADAIDCPVCGAQHVLKDRLPKDYKPVEEAEQ